MAKLLVHLKNTVVHAVRDHMTGGQRSPLWPAVERAFRETASTCAICGATERIQVHHKKPFHLYPGLELDLQNLVSLCMTMENECHLLVGHGHDFKAYNPRIDEHVRRAGGKKRDLAVITAEAKNIRQYT